RARTWGAQPAGLSHSAGTEHRPPGLCSMRLTECILIRNAHLHSEHLSAVRGKLPRTTGSRHRGMLPRIQPPRPTFKITICDLKRLFAFHAAPRAGRLGSLLNEQPAGQTRLVKPVES